MEEKLTDKIDKLTIALKDLENNKNSKDFKLPLGITLGAGKVKKNFILAIILRTNGRIILKWLPIEDDTVMFNEQIYSASANYILRYKKHPVVIIKEWSSEPFSPVETYGIDEQKKTLVAGQKYIMTKMKLEAIKPKMNLNPKVILIILAILGIGYYALSKMGVF